MSNTKIEIISNIELKNSISKEDRITSPYMTKYERTRIL